MELNLAKSGMVGRCLLQALCRTLFVLPAVEIAQLHTDISNAIVQHIRYGHGKIFRELPLLKLSIKVDATPLLVRDTSVQAGYFFSSCSWTWSS